MGAPWKSILIHRSPLKRRRHQRWFNGRIKRTQSSTVSTFAPILMLFQNRSRRRKRTVTRQRRPPKSRKSTTNVIASLCRMTLPKWKSISFCIRFTSKKGTISMAKVERPRGPFGPIIPALYTTIPPATAVDVGTPFWLTAAILSRRDENGFTETDCVWTLWESIRYVETA